MSTTPSEVSSLPVSAAPAWHRELRDRSAEVDKLAGALAKAQASIQPALKDSTNPHFKSNYADLASVFAACREALTNNDLAIVQRTIGDGASVGITTTLLHGSGQWIEGTIKVNLANGATPQHVGSALTYLRRYSLAAMVGVAPDDDDGNAASTRSDPPANDNGQGYKSPARRDETPPVRDAQQPPPSSPKFSLASLRKFHALRTSLGVSEDEARDRTSKVLGRKVTSINDLNAEEMKVMIDKMERAANGDVS